MYKMSQFIKLIRNKELTTLQILMTDTFKQLQEVVDANIFCSNEIIFDHGKIVFNYNEVQISFRMPFNLEFQATVLFSSLFKIINIEQRNAYTDPEDSIYTLYIDYTTPDLINAICTLVDYIEHHNFN